MASPEPAGCHRLRPRAGSGGRGRCRRWASLIALTALFIGAVLCLAGCWNRMEIEDLAFVSAAGVDIDPATGVVNLTVHILKPKVSGMVTGYAEKPFLQVSSSGRTVFEAVRNAVQQVQQRLFWAHNKVLVIGEETARQGVLKIIDFFVRDGETRHDVMMVVAKGMTANHLLKSEYELDTVPGVAMARHIRSARTWLSTAIAMDLHEFMVHLQARGIEPMATRMEVFPKEPGDPIGELMREKVVQSPFVGGAAVFRGDRLVGWLEPLETRGLLWLRGDVRGGILVIPDPWQEANQISLQVVRSHSSFEFSETTAGMPVVKVEIEGHAYLGDVQTPVDPLKMADFEARMNTLFEAEIRAEVMSALEHLQKELRSDPVGFGSALYRQNPALWRKVENRWSEVFAQLEMEIEIRARVLRSGTDTATVMPR